MEPQGKGHGGPCWASLLLRPRCHMGTSGPYLSLPDPPGLYHPVDHQRSSLSAAPQVQEEAAMPTEVSKFPPSRKHSLPQDCWAAWRGDWAGMPTLVLPVGMFPAFSRS